MNRIDTRKYIVVYQFGKVASTSIVNSLNGIAGITAVQSHFLGLESLRQIVDLLVDIDRPSYFIEHNFGQFTHNLKITRDIQEFRAGRRAGERLAIISLSREPLDWVRSSVAQDIRGYLESFEALARQRGLDHADQGAMIAMVLPTILRDMVDAIRRVGGVDAFLKGSKRWNEAFPPSENQSRDHFLRRFLAMMLRPFEWFDLHFESALGIRLDSLGTLAPNLLHGDKGWAEVFILRYEDIPSSMRIIGERLGIERDFVLSKDNVSSEKLFAKAVDESFAGPDAAELAALFRETRYARLFGY